jgi:DNA-directed RNA polymerase I and III subunit RPAC1
MKGVGPAIANAFRRILLAEVPTMAIEKVFVVNNTSVIPDEVLSHRLGLVPLNCDPTRFEFRAEGDAAHEHNTVVLRLALRCSRRPDGEVANARVTSADLEWLPLGSALPEDAEAKLTSFAKDQNGVLAAPASAVHPDILLAKLRPGQEIELEAHAVKGKGKTHAKWSPVGTSWYELCPEIVTLEPLHGDDARAFIAAAHPPGAVRGEQSCFGLGGAGGDTLEVRASRGCWYCREKVRTMSGEPRWAPHIQLRRIKEHYLFTVESVGQMPPETLFTQAVDILREKSLRLLSIL